jgi:hypothetical protein
MAFRKSAHGAPPAVISLVATNSWKEYSTEARSREISLYFGRDFVVAFGDLVGSE